MDKINKYLTEAMGECWHKDTLGCSDFTCPLCGKLRGTDQTLKDIRTDFFTWEGFGKLFTWSKEQRWWIDFILQPTQVAGIFEFTIKVLTPTNFANAIYEYLKESDNG